MSPGGMIKPLFPLGRLLTTPSVSDLAVSHDTLGRIIARHANGDWGDLDPHDVRTNEEAV